jgi:CheY-like chemotaxis protein
MSESYAPTVVLAEPGALARRQAAAVLRKKQFRVAVVKDREGLIREVAESQPELVLLDYVFDKELPRLVLALKVASPGSPVLITVDKAKAALAVRDADVNVADLLLKPFAEPELAFRIDRCIRAGRRARSAAVRYAADRGELLVSPPMMSLAEPVSVPSPGPSPSGLRDPNNGRLDAKRVADYLDVSLKQLADALGENYKAIHKTPSKAALQPKLLPIERTVSILDERFGGRGRARAWLNTPHPVLDGRTGLDLILAGHATVVSDMLEAAEAGLPS